MPLVDDRGRVLGRFNLIDLALGIVLLGLIPLGYGAYVLFKVPPPRLTAVEPVTRQFEPEFRVTVQGENLRPYMRVSLNDMQGRAFLFKGATSAEVVFGDVPPGQYDVVLYDNAQERHRLPKAFTLTQAALPPAQLDVAGFITGIEPEAASRVAPGVRFGVVAEVLAAGKPAPDLARVMSGDKPLDISIEKTVRVPALLRVNCNVVSREGTGVCVAGKVLAPNSYLDLPKPNGHYPFLITELRPAAAPTAIEVGVRLDAGDPALPVIKPGDTDVGYSQNEFSGGGRVLTSPNGAREVTLRMPAYATLTGWTYAGQPLRAGAPLIFVSSRYQFNGLVTSVPPMPPPKQ